MSVSDEYIMDTFKEYCGLKIHFNMKNFIYTTPKQMKYSVESLLKRNDWPMFKKIATKFECEPDKRKEFLISLFVMKKDAHISDTFTFNMPKFHESRMKVVNSLKQYVDKDIEVVLNYCSNNKTLKQILDTNGDRPLIYKELNLNVETLTIIHNLYHFNDDTINPLWKSTVFFYTKYNEFIYNKELYQYVKDKLENSLSFSNVVEEEKQLTLESLLF